jgi:tetratricopeptide (TPR) repeat protein
MKALLSVVAMAAGLSVAGAIEGGVPDENPTITDAQSAFYNARYEHAAALALALRTANPEDLTAYELRGSALHFQVKNALGSDRDRRNAIKDCAPCAAWMTAFMDETTRGQQAARKRLAVNPRDEEALFFLGKINLNYVWLQLGTMGRKTGWDEYWEARKSLDAVLKANPGHVRARVARAWIDYIVDTRMPRGTRWMLGGGNRKRALTMLGDAVKADAEFYVHVEAEFSLWDMLVRERSFDEAIALAQKLLRDFPENRDLIGFLAAHPAGAPRS